MEYITTDEAKQLVCPMLSNNETRLCIHKNCMAWQKKITINNSNEISYPDNVTFVGMGYIDGKLHWKEFSEHFGYCKLYKGLHE